MAAALELSMATEKIVVAETQKGVQRSDQESQCGWGAASDIRFDKLLRLKNRRTKFHCQTHAG
jgi:hypothetical protein